MADFINVKFKTKTRELNIKMENECSFENNGKIYRVDNNKLSVFDKANKTWSTNPKNSEVKITDYQLQAIEAFANNVHEGKNKKDVILSSQDIDEGMKMYSEGQFKADIDKELKGGYEAGKSWLFRSFNAIASYINNGNSGTSGNLVFSYGSKSNSEEISSVAKECFSAWADDLKISQTKPEKSVKNEKLEKTENPVIHDNNSKLFDNKNINKHNSFIHTLKSGESIISLAQKYNIDTYQIIAANPQLKEGKDYKVTYTNKWPLTDISDFLKAGTKIVIPARYSIKPRTAKSIDEVAKVTNISADYLKDLLTVTEVKPNHPGKPDKTAYPDGGWIFYDAKGRALNKRGRWSPPKGTRPASASGKGTATIAYGHAGGFDGNKLVLPKWNSKKQRFEGGTTVTDQKARDLLCNDILKHHAMAVAYFGEAYTKAPESVRSALFDVVYNKGIWNGYTHPRKNERTKLVKKNLQDKQYASAMVNSRWMGTDAIELKRRNVYRFISGLRDLTPAQRQSAMKAYQKYYESVLKSSSGLDYKYLQKAWENAKNGKVTNFRMKAAQTDRK